MKTVREWIQELPSPYREKILHYHETNHRCVQEWMFLDNSASNLADAVMDGLEWSKSDEGEDYWGAVFHTAITGKLTPNLAHWIYLV